MITGWTELRLYLSVFQGDDTGILSGADDVVIVVDPLNGPLAKSFNTV